MITQLKNKNFLNKLNQNKEFSTLMQVLSESGQKFYVVGGAVRNFLALQAIYDIDIASSFTPQENLKLLTKNNIKVINKGIEFGTIVAIVNGKAFEITSFRKDIEQDGRHTKVIYTTNMQEDAQRRDFTYNALYYCTKTNTIYDFFNGIKDLKQGNTVFIGNPEQRIKEDFLRILRYFRFASSYNKNGFNKELIQTFKSLKQGLGVLSRQRISEEFLKTCNTKNIAEVLFTLSDSGIFSDIFTLKFCSNKKTQLQNLFMAMQNIQIYTVQTLVLSYLAITKSVNLKDILLNKKQLKQIESIENIFNHVENKSVEEITLLLEANTYEDLITALELKSFMVNNGLYKSIAKNMPKALSFPFNGAIFNKEDIKKQYIKTALYDLKLSYLKHQNLKQLPSIIAKYKKY